MYKIFTRKYGEPIGCTLNLLLIMKMIIIILLTTILQASAGTTYAQKVSISEKNASLEVIFTKIRAQSGYDFFYNQDLIRQAKRVSLNVENASIEQVMDICLQGLNLDYKIENKIVVIKKKEESFFGSIISRFLKINITGKVVDEDGNLLPGITITVKGTKIATVTDGDGRFALQNVPENGVLVFNSLNTETKEVHVSPTQLDYMVSLAVKVNNLNEVAVTVNTGYQTITKEKSTSSVVTVNAKQLEERYNPNLLDQLEGRVPGLVTYSTGLNGNVRSPNTRSVTIRGVSTFNANLNVLLVVDGLPIEGTIEDINPYDVESIFILKDAAATSLYGARASNGVIVITTKKPKYNRTTIEASTDITINKKPDFSYLNYMTSAQQVDYEAKVNRYYFNNPNVADPYELVDLYTDVPATPGEPNYNYPVSPITYLFYKQKKGLITMDQLNSSLAALKKNDFVKQYSDSALLNELMQQYNFSVRAGGTKFQSSVVLNYRTSNKGIVNANNNSLNLSYKGNYTVTKWLNFDFGVNSVFKNDKSQFDSRATTPFNVPAYQQLLEADGSRTQYYLDVNGNNTFIANNPLFKAMNFNHLDELDRDFTKTQTLNTRMFVHANAKIIDGVKFSSQFQYEDLRSDLNTHSEEESYTSRFLYNSFATGSAAPYTFLIPSVGGRLAVNSSRGRNYTFRNQFDYSHIFSEKHVIDAIGGFELRQTFLRGSKYMYLGYNDQLLTNANSSVSLPALLAAANGGAFNPAGLLLTTSSINIGSAYNMYILGANGLTEDFHRNSSGYLNVNYMYDNRYSLYGSIRKDVADLFGADANQKGRPFYSVGLSWNIHNESFMKSVAQIDFLKLRLTRGTSGNVDNSTSKYATASTSVNTVTGTTALNVSTPANINLTWELTTTTNLGLDFALFKNRINGTIDAYYKGTSNLITYKILPADEGFTSARINDGDVVNKGFETSLNIGWIKANRKGGLSVSTTVNYRYNVNKITHTDNAVTSAYALLSPGSGRAIQEGYPVNSLFSYNYAGLNAAGQPEWILADGTKTMQSLTGANIAPNNVKFSGTIDPKTTMGFAPEISFRNFNLSAQFVYYGGHVMRADQATLGEDGTAFTFYGPVSNNLLNSWTPTNTNTYIPGILENYPTSVYTNSSASIMLTYSDKFVQPADFIKMRTATISYLIPTDWAKKISASSIRLRFQVQNAWTVWTKNKIGIDPEANNAWLGGRSLPLQRGFIFGANVNF